MGCSASEYWRCSYEFGSDCQPAGPPAPARMREGHCAKCRGPKRWRALFMSCESLQNRAFVPPECPACPSPSTLPAAPCRPWPSSWPRRRCSGRRRCWGWTNPNPRPPHRCLSQTPARRLPPSHRPVRPADRCPHRRTRPASRPRHVNSWRRASTRAGLAGPMAVYRAPGATALRRLVCHRRSPVARPQRHQAMRLHRRPLPRARQPGLRRALARRCCAWSARWWRR